MMMVMMVIVMIMMDIMMVTVAPSSVTKIYSAPT